VIWLAWRQHRGQLLSAAVGLALLAVFLFVTGSSMRHTFTTSGLSACLDRVGGASMVDVTKGEGCREIGEVFASRYFGLRLLGLVLFTLVPLLVGMFWGAPLIAKEVEQGTDALVWTQGVSRRRWAFTKFAMVATMTILAVGAYAGVVAWWYAPLNAASGERFQWLIFDQQGLVPVGFALFALALGVLAGAITGRTLRAMAVTVVGFLVVRFAVAVWLRPHYLAALERRYPVLGSMEPNRLLGDWLIGGGGPGVGGVYDALGHKLQGGQTMCPPPVAQACIDEVGRGAYNFEIYQPAHRFWTFQSIETAIFVALALLLLLTAVWWLRRRMA
jgi:hypothetical protein